MLEFEKDPMRGGRPLLQNAHAGTRTVREGPYEGLKGSTGRRRSVSSSVREGPYEGLKAETD